MVRAVGLGKNRVSHLGRWASEGLLARSGDMFDGHGKGKECYWHLRCCLINTLQYTGMSLPKNEPALGGETLGQEDGFRV
jgi:hypothetical protein